MNSLKVMASIPRYKLMRSFGRPKTLPLNLTVSLTYRCNSRCKTCNIWKKNSERELSREEYQEIFKKLGEAYWFTMSGGEPFLRKDIVEICKIAHDYCSPGIINIPTNGLLNDVIPGRVEEILEVCPDSKVIVNLSLDGAGEQHDSIRGVKGSYEKAMKTYSALSELNQENFELGIHTVISIFNVHDLPDVYEKLKELSPDSYITEIAEEREELGTTGMRIAPSPEEYSQAIDCVVKQMDSRSFRYLPAVTQAFRFEYYKLVKKILKEKKQIVPCYAGFASAQIAPDGDVWTCCIRAEPAGNLRDVDYDFKKIWFSDRAEALRKKIMNKECYCPLANASYTNMLMNPVTLFKVFRRVISNGLLSK